MAVWLMANITSLSIENDLHDQGVSVVSGLDEVGRGALAGPVAASIVAFSRDVEKEKLSDVNDSKKLSSAKRERLSVIINNLALICEVGFASAEEIDNLGIVESTKLAMRRALKKSIIKSEYLLVDALDLTEWGIPCRSIIKGDQISTTIAAASIVAKVARDSLMIEFNQIYPRYKFDSNKGYGTKDHIESLQKYGPSSIHRKSFAPIYNLTRK